MLSQHSRPSKLAFGPFEFDPGSGDLFKHGFRVRLASQPCRVLDALVDRPGEVVTREDLRNRLWPSATFGDFEHGLNAAVNKLRQSLGDVANQPLYVETLPGVGYRFVAPVYAAGGVVPELVPDPVKANRLNEVDFVETSANGGIVVDPMTQIDKPAHDRERSRSRSWLLVGPVIFTAGAVILIVGFATAIWYLRNPLPPPRLTNSVQLTRDGRRKNVIGTDGNRLYLNILEPKGVGVVPVSGGLITEISFDLPSQGGLWGVSSLSPDGSTLLALDHFDIFRESAKVSIVGILGHPVRYLTESYAAIFSPDGRSVLYATPHGDVYSMAVEGGEPRLILASDAAEGEHVRIGDLSWSPGGTTIRFTRDQKMWEVSSSGSNLHQLLPGWHASASQWGGQWTLDGEFFLFVSGSIGSMNRFPNYNHGGQLWAIDERRGRLRPPIAEPIQLTSGPMDWGPAVSDRDGHRVFSRGRSVRGELVRYDKRSNHFDPYLSGISAEMVAFSKDGTHVVYVTSPDGVLWRAHRDGTGLVQLTKPPFYPRDVRWSPDGSEIVFTDNSQNSVDAVYVVPSQGGTPPKRLIPEESGPHADLTWSPDGKKVVYSTVPWQGVGNFSPAKIEVRILELATRRIITLPHRPEGFCMPRWSPDGRYIAGLPLKVDNLSIFDLRTQRWKDLRLKGLNTFPSWSKDGRFIYFLRSTDDRGVFRIAISGGDEERIVDLKEFRSIGWYTSFCLGLDPNDAPLLLRDAGTDEIYALTLEQK
jgi:Tol biopolymer transport system component/DNA-binding winged helix-turn-helix (wHTH) protein